LKEEGGREGKEGVVVARAMGNCRVYTHKSMPMDGATVKRVGCVKKWGSWNDQYKEQRKKKVHDRLKIEGVKIGK